MHTLIAILVVFALGSAALIPGCIASLVTADSAKPDPAAVVLAEGLQTAIAEPALVIGALAPPLYVAGWLRGEGVSRFEPGQVYVVEHWASWCKVCIEEIPHLTKLADIHRAAGLVVLGINVMEDGTALERVAEARAVVDNHAEAIGYDIGFDEGGLQEARWLSAAGLEALPACFVVDRDSRIAWIGHPKDVEPVAAAVLAGTWDAERARWAARNTVLAPHYAERVVGYLAGPDSGRGHRLAEALITTLFADRPAMLAGMAYHIYASPDVVDRDLGVAERAACRAASLGDHAAAWDLVAQIHTARDTVSRPCATEEVLP
ncbi:MAG: thiol-disulfide isomerase/thioredoxin [Myxococcota bacterium]|jgi:thiol-disulfide isomerase/thioredoxin